MGLVELFVLALGLSMDAFAVSICKGLSLGKIRKKHMFIAGIWFGGFQALMPLLGYLMGTLFADKLIQYAHWIAFILLVLIGVSMIKEAKEETKETCPECAGENDASMKAGSMFILAIATSIDALAVGVTFAFLKVSIVPAVSFIGVVTFICSALGIKIGSIFGVRYRARAELFGGMILILIGIKTLLEGVGM